MLSLFYTIAVLMVFAYFMVMPKKKLNNPPSEGNDDGGEPIDYDLPDLDLPPGISLPINDFEPDYNRKPSRIFVDEGGTLVYAK